MCIVLPEKNHGKNGTGSPLPLIEMKMDQQHPHKLAKTGGDNLTSQTQWALVTASVAAFSAFCCFAVGFSQHAPTAASPRAPAGFRETVLLKPLTQFTATTSRKALASQWVYCRDKKCSQTGTLCNTSSFCYPWFISMPQCNSPFK